MKALILAFAVLLAGATPASAAPVPGFEDRLVTDEVVEPTSLGFTPDGRMLIAERPGMVRIHLAGSLLPAPAIDLGPRLCTDMERGLLGLAIDPAFATNHYIYLYYTFKKYGACDIQTATIPVNRIARFTLGDDDTIDPASELVLVDNIPSVAGIHNGGDLQFGRDGYLYATVGDSFCDYRYDSGCGLLNDAARDLSGLEGKILRITSTGEIPPSNPYQGAGTERCNVAGRATIGNTCQEIFAWGLRNPWRIAFDPTDAGTRFYMNDVGQDKWEEINVGQAGADYGWHLREGHCTRDSYTDCPPPPAGMTDPVYDYDHQTGCTSITGGAFVPPGSWPTSMTGEYLFADLTCGQIFRLTPLDGGGYSRVTFADDVPVAVSMTFGPSPEGDALYYLSWGGYQVRRIVYTGAANRAPVAAGGRWPPAGQAPHWTNFWATGSFDPDDDPISYEWDFGDGTPHAPIPEPRHLYDSPGIYTATLMVRDGNGGEDHFNTTVHVGYDLPVPTINAPGSTHRFRVGEPITLTGSATDAQDGPLPDSSLRWRVIKRHAYHTHPFLPLTTGNNIQIVGPQPEDIQASTDSYLEIELTATDSDGLSQTVTRELRPNTVDLTFVTEPAGRVLEVAGSTITGPRTVTSWEGWDLTAKTQDQIDATGADWRFQGWSDGGAPTHTITTPATPTTYTARFKRVFGQPGSASPLSVSLVPVFRQCGTGANPANGAHPPPLGGESCAPPATTGTADAGGAFSGLAQLDVVPGDSDPGNGNQADVHIGADMSDVVTGLGADYDPVLGGADMRLSARLRLTDQSNGATASELATTTDLTYAIPVECTATIDPTVGAACSADTTMNALTPGAVLEGKETVVQVFRMRVDDGGPNGTPGDTDDALFAQQGVYVP